MIREALQSVWSKATGPFTRRIAKQRLELKLPTAIKAAYVAAIGLLMAGIVAAVTYPVSNQNYFIYPSSSGQSYIETLLYIMIIGFGASGAWIAIESGKIAVKSKDSYLAISLVLLIVAVLLGIFVTGSK